MTVKSLEARKPDKVGNSPKKTYYVDILYRQQKRQLDFENRKLHFKQTAEVVILYTNSKQSNFRRFSFKMVHLIKIKY